MLTLVKNLFKTKYSYTHLKKNVNKLLFAPSLYKEMLLLYEETLLLYIIQISLLYYMFQEIWLAVLKKYSIVTFCNILYYCSIIKQYGSLKKYFVPLKIILIFFYFWKLLLRRWLSILFLIYISCIITLVSAILLTPTKVLILQICRQYLEFSSLIYKNFWFKIWIP